VRGVDPRVALRSENAMIKVRGTPQCRLHNGPDRTSPRAVFFFWHTVPDARLSMRGLQCGAVSAARQRIGLSQSA
jgi:hypothetical protein